MKRSLLLLLAVPLWAHQAVDQTQQKRDTPTEHQGTNNPDISQRQTPPPKAKTAPKNDKTLGQQPGTNNPDIGKRNAPKKNKRQPGTSTSTSSNEK